MPSRRVVTKRLIIAVLLCALAGQASADDFMAFKDYDKFKDLDEFKLFIFGVGTGLQIANVECEKLYCPPEKLAMTMDVYIRVLDSRVKELRPYVTEPNLSLSLVLLSGLQETFPCQTPKKK